MSKLKPNTLSIFKTRGNKKTRFFSNLFLLRISFEFYFVTIIFEKFSNSSNLSKILCSIMSSQAFWFTSFSCYYIIKWMNTISLILYFYVKSNNLIYDSNISKQIPLNRNLLCYQNIDHKMPSFSSILCYDV